MLDTFSEFLSLQTKRLTVLTQFFALLKETQYEPEKGQRTENTCKEITEGIQFERRDALLAIANIPTCPGEISESEDQAD